jgi:Family of unknown function (DUF5989)
MSRRRVVTDVCRFLISERKYWLLPVVLVLVLLGLVLASSQHSVLAPFIYSLF